MNRIMDYNMCDAFLNGREHRTHVDGTFYQMPNKFPCVLHDRKGCLHLSQNKYSELVKMNIIRESMGGTTGKLNICDGISRISGYQLCEIKEHCPKYKARKKMIAIEFF